MLPLPSQEWPGHCHIAHPSTDLPPAPDVVCRVSYLRVWRGTGPAQVPLALLACRAGVQHIPQLSVTGLSLHCPAVKGIGEEQVGPCGSLHFGPHIQPAQDLVAPSSRQSQAPVAPHISPGGPGPCSQSALGLAFPLALPASDARGGIT